MDAEKKARLQIMLKREGKSHEEISEILRQWEKSEEEELEAQIEATETVPISEPEESEEEQLKARLKSLKESKRQERERQKQEQEENLNAHKHEVLGKIEEQLLEREKVLNRVIDENLKLRDELIKQNASATKQFAEDRIKERESYRKELDGFFSKVYDTILNFSDSPTEQSLICLFSRQGTVVTLNGLLSSKKIVTKDEIKLGD